MKLEKVKKRRSKLTYWIGVLFILAGALLLGKNLGYIDEKLYSMFISWPALIAVYSVYLLTERRYFVGFILLSSSVFYMLDVIGEYGANLSDYYLPAVLILAGLFFLVRRIMKPAWKYSYVGNRASRFTSEAGFFTLENSFGASRQAIVYEEIKGGIIKNSFGGVALDLRRATLPQGHTYIDVDGQFGGIEIYLPSTWAVRIELKTFLAGVEDNRLKGNLSDMERVLVIRGKISFSGIEIKS